jgi:hypothetical protein
LLQRLRAVHRELAHADEEFPEASFPLIPDIRNAIAQEIETIDADAESRAHIFGGLARLALDDIRFSRSKIGQDVLEVSEEYARRESGAG